MNKAPTRRVARIWKRGGGLFWKSEKTANDLDPNFHCSWIRITRFIRKFRRIFSLKSEVQTLFQPKNRWSQKKKKKVFAEIETDFPDKIGNSNAFSGRFTASTSQLRHPISFGGAVFIFSPKIGLKSTKNVRFCILYRLMGGLEPPPPTLLAPTEILHGL